MINSQAQPEAIPNRPYGVGDFLYHGKGAIAVVFTDEHGELKARDLYRPSYIVPMTGCIVVSLTTMQGFRNYFALLLMRRVEVAQATDEAECVRRDLISLLTHPLDEPQVFGSLGGVVAQVFKTAADAYFSDAQKAARMVASQLVFGMCSPQGVE